jgi:hypothetical protein
MPAKHHILSENKGENYFFVYAIITYQENRIRIHYKC